MYLYEVVMTLLVHIFGEEDPVMINPGEMYNLIIADVNDGGNNMLLILEMQAHICCMLSALADERV